MIGIDAVDIERLRRALERSPGLAQKLFTSEEERYCSSQADPTIHLAGTLAAKEAVMKALGVGSLGAWAKRIEITREPEGAPCARVDQSSRSFGLSITHDGGLAIAAAISQQDLSHNVERVEASVQRTKIHTQRAGGPPVCRYVLEN